MKRHLFLLGLFPVFFSCTAEQGTDDPKQHTNIPAAEYVPVSQTLYNEIRRQDSLLFAAFNAHDSKTLMGYFSEDLEFYHDKGGLSDHAGTRQGFERLFANNRTTGLRRDLVPGSLEVYPINDYGAVETCLHRFCHNENGKQDCGTFKNVMIWQKAADGWKVTRVISYDH